MIHIPRSYLPFTHPPTSAHAEYINAIRDLFVSHGFSVELKLGRAPDTDVIYMGRADYFFQGGGGFSYVLAGLNRKLGGTVFCNGRVFKCWEGDSR